MCSNQPHSLPFQCERNLNSYLGKIVLGDTGSPPSQSPGFLSKVTIACPNNLSLDLSTCHESACQYRRLKRPGFKPWVRKIPWGGHGNRLEYSCLENPRNKGDWHTTVQRVAKSWTQFKWLSMNDEQHESGLSAWTADGSEMGKGGPKKLGHFKIFKLRKIPLY